MIHGDLEFNNTVELELAAGGGVYLRRFPKAVREALSPLGRIVSQESAGCEIRFVTEAESLRLAVSAQPADEGIGFRQMIQTIGAYRNFRVWELKGAN